MKIFVMILGSILGLASCEGLMEKFYPLLFFNTSNAQVALYFVKPGGGNLYPDTTLLENQPVFISIPSNADAPAYLKVKYELFFQELPSDTLSVFIIHSDSLAKYDWNTIRKDYNVLKRYDLSLEDLQRLNFKVPYPPKEDMKDVKMWPEY